MESRNGLRVETLGAAAKKARDGDGVVPIADKTSWVRPMILAGRKVMAPWGIRHFGSASEEGKRKCIKGLVGPGEHFGSAEYSATKTREAVHEGTSAIFEYFFRL